MVRRKQVKEKVRKGNEWEKQRNMRKKTKDAKGENFNGVMTEQSMIFWKKRKGERNYKDVKRDRVKEREEK
jgi:hypothetical protein